MFDVKNLDVTAIGSKLTKDQFDQLWASAPDLTNDLVGMGIGKAVVESNKGKNNVGRFLFVKDSVTGAYCAYVQTVEKDSKTAVETYSEGRFIEGIDLDGSKKSVKKLHCLDTDPKIKIDFSTKDTKIVDALSNICKAGYNPNFSQLCKGITSRVIFGSKKDDISSGTYYGENWYRIETKEGKKDTPLGYLVRAKHPTKDDGSHSLYFLPKLEQGGVAIDLTDPAKIVGNGGVVVHDVGIDKNNQLKIRYYKDKDSKRPSSKKIGFDREGKEAKKEAKAKNDGTVAVDLLKWNEGKAYDNAETKKIHKIAPTLKTRLALKITAIAVSITIAASALVSVIVIPQVKKAEENRKRIIRLAAEEKEELLAEVPNESDKARVYGASQVEARKGEGSLLNYNESGKHIVVSVGNVFNIINSKFDIWQQEELRIFKEGTAEEEIIGVGKFDYTLQTIEGSFKKLGALVAEELIKNNVSIVLRENPDEDATVKMVYPVNPLSPTSAMLSSEKMRSFLMNDVGYTLEEAVEAVEAYEEGYRIMALEKAAAEEVIIGGGSEIVPVDYSDPAIGTEIAAVIGKYSENGKKYKASAINIAYSSINEQVIFANTTDGAYLFKIDLTNGGKNNSEISSNDDLLARIKAADNVTESVQLDKLLKGLKIEKALEGFKNNYSSQNQVFNPVIYVTNCDVLKESLEDPDKFEMTPKITIVSDNGAFIEEMDTNMVSFDADNGKDISVKEMIALSVFGYGVIDKIVNPDIYVITETADNSKPYSDNDLEVDIMTQASQTATAKSGDEKVL